MVLTLPPIVFNLYRLEDWSFWLYKVNTVGGGVTSQAYMEMAMPLDLNQCLNA